MADHTFDWFFGENQKDGRWLVSDLETNGLLDSVTDMWSFCLKDIHTGERWSCADQPGFTPIEEGLEVYQDAAIVFGHNFVPYDSKVLDKLYPGVEHPLIRDTLTLAKMIWPTDLLRDLDFQRWRKGSLPGQLIGAQKLEAWGYRLGLQKGEYAKKVQELNKVFSKSGDPFDVPEEFRRLIATDAKGNPKLWEWHAWCLPMQVYCDLDCDVTEALVKLVMSHLEGTTKAARGIGWAPSPVKLEHDVLDTCLQQEADGYGFDLDGAIKLTGSLKTRERELEASLKDAFGTWWQPITKDVKNGEKPARDRNVKLTHFEDVTIERVSEKTGKPLKPYVGPPLCEYKADAPFVRIQFTEFNPTSRPHLGERLQKVYGWQPIEWVGKNKDQAKVDETTIKEIPTSILPEDLKDMILEYLVVSKTLGQLANGKKNWINLVRDGRIHGRVDPLGTVSHRAAHKDPNLAQVPSVSLDDDDKPIPGWKGGFGVECRSLFRPGQKGWQQTGTDASGLELRMLGHYLWPYDDGEFARLVADPDIDIHAYNGQRMGLSRSASKTMAYLIIYGGGNVLAGTRIGLTPEEEETLGKTDQAKNYVRFMRKTFRDFVEPDEKTLAYWVKGKQVKDVFMANIKGLKDLQKDLAEEAKQYGFIRAIDGRKLYIRKAHAALNQLLQGGGAVVCKVWMKALGDRLKQAAIPHVQMAWVHDECQFEHEAGFGKGVGYHSHVSMKEAQRILDFRGELDTDSKTGRNWMECH